MIDKNKSKGYLGGDRKYKIHVSQNTNPAKPWFLKDKPIKQQNNFKSLLITGLKAYSSFEKVIAQC